MIKKKYRVAGLGGTFDRFHIGHRWFLEQASSFADLLVIGIATESLLHNKQHASVIEPYPARFDAVRRFLTAKCIPHELVPLSDVAGPTLTDDRIETIIVTTETLAGGLRVNELRQRAHLSDLPITEIALTSIGADRTSSQAIRRGFMNRSGAVYADLIKTTIDLNDFLRKKFADVQGELVASIDNSDQLRYLVGDSTVRRFQKDHAQYQMAIIDGKEKREQYFPPVIDPSMTDLVIVNPAGKITSMLMKGVQLALKQKLTHIFIDGEEDLAAAALMLALPLQSVIYYGQPDTGLVRWVVTEQEKERLALLLNPHFQTNPKLVE